MQNEISLIHMWIWEIKIVIHMEQEAKDLQMYFEEMNMKDHVKCLIEK